MLLWESILAGLTTVSGGLAVADIVPVKWVGGVVIVLSGLNAFTIAYKQGLQSNVINGGGHDGQSSRT